MESIPIPLILIGVLMIFMPLFFMFTIAYEENRFGIKDFVQSIKRRYI